MEAFAVGRGALYYLYLVASQCNIYSLSEATSWELISACLFVNEKWEGHSVSFLSHSLVVVQPKNSLVI